MTTFDEDTLQLPEASLRFRFYKRCRQMSVHTVAFPEPEVGVVQSAFQFLANDLIERTTDRAFRKAPFASSKIRRKGVRAAIIYSHHHICKELRYQDHNINSKWWYIRTMPPPTQIHQEDCHHTDNLRHQHNHPGGGLDDQVLRQS